MIILNYDEVSKLIDFDLSLKWIKEYFVLKQNNQIIEPQRYSFTSHNENDSLYLGGASIVSNKNVVIGYKNVNFFKENYEKYRMSNIFGSISIINSNNGIVSLIADARRITYMRTVATLTLFLEKRLKNDEKIGIIGAGQMLYYIMGFITKISPVRQFHIYSKRITHRKKWLKLIEKEFDVSFHVSNINEIINISETLILATNEVENHVIENKGNLVNICAIGSISKTYKGEVGLEIYREVKDVVCDDVNAVLEEHGTISQIRNHISFHTINHELEIKKSLIFRSVGLMSQDIYFAYKLLNLIGVDNSCNMMPIDNLDLSYTWDL